MRFHEGRNNMIVFYLNKIATNLNQKLHRRCGSVCMFEVAVDWRFIVRCLFCLRPPSHKGLITCLRPYWRRDQTKTKHIECTLHKLGHTTNVQAFVELLCVWEDVFRFQLQQGLTWQNIKIQQQLYRGVDLRAQSKLQGQSQLNHNNNGGRGGLRRPPSLLSFDWLWPWISPWALRSTPLYNC